MNINTKYMIKTMQAYLNGETIEACNKSTNFIWIEENIPLWDWNHSDYRTKLIPKELWVNEDDFEDSAVFIAYQSKAEAVNAHKHSITKTETAVHYKEVL